jgi:hypothetical protein
MIQCQILKGQDDMNQEAICKKAKQDLGEWFAGCIRRDRSAARGMFLAFGFTVAEAKVMADAFVEDMVNGDIRRNFEGPRGLKSKEDVQQEFVEICAKVADTP